MCTCALQNVEADIYSSLPGGPRLKAEDVILHFMTIIKDPKYHGYVHVRVEFCKLLKNILSFQVYQCDITVNTWQGIAN